MLKSTFFLPDDATLPLVSDKLPGIRTPLQNSDIVNFANLSWKQVVFDSLMRISTKKGHLKDKPSVHRAGSFWSTLL